MTSAVLAAIAGTGIYLLYTATVFGRRHLVDAGISSAVASHRHRINDWLIQAGLTASDRRQLCAVVTALFSCGYLVAWITFGGVMAPLLTGVFVASFPVTSYRARRHRRHSDAADAWPRMIEEIRLLCGSAGRPIPQALLEVGRQGPLELRSAFVEAEREWMISTDFERTIKVIKDRLADPTADATCETLLVAHRVGGSDVDRRLRALADDRHLDLQGRKDARAKQAGVRFARRFVLLVPMGMALAGLSIGDGRAAYQTSEGQVGVALAIVTLAACWWWAGVLIRLPEEERVFRA